MRRYSVFSTLCFLSATAVIGLLAACSGGSTIAPASAPTQAVAPFLGGRLPSALYAIGKLRTSTRFSQRFVGHYSCPANGPVKYVSDYNNNVINIYSGKFAGQSPCGQITAGLLAPEGLFVSRSTHDLYVANTGANSILVFHRGQLTAYNTYTDPTGQNQVDVSVARDGTLIVSNVGNLNNTEKGSISTWTVGPNGGTFVGNFPMTNDVEGLWLTIRRNGTVYYADIDVTTYAGVLWHVNCPAGVCGPETQVAGVSFDIPFGMASDTGEDLLVNNYIVGSAGTADTFELPNPNPKNFPLIGAPVGLAMNELDHHWFVADALNNNAAEYLYPSGKLVGTVPGLPGGQPIGIAVDPGHSL